MSDSVHARSGAVKTVVGNTPGRRIRVAVLVALLGIHAGLLAYSASKHSPVWEEYWHLLAGISHWETGRFDLFRVNPPLVRTVATIPVMFSGYETDWTGYIAPDGTRPEQWLREDLFRLNGPRIFWLTTLARWMCVPFSLLGGLVCYLWARKLWGASSGLVAATIWCFSPNVLGNGQLIMPDVAAASVGVTGHFAFWRYLSVPSTRGAIVSGVLLGLTLLTKSTWIVLPPIWVTLWLAWWWRRAMPRGLPATRNSELRFSSACCPELGDGSNVGEKPARPRWREFLLLAFVSCYVLNIGYLFEGTFTPFGQYRFISETLGGDPKNARFAATHPPTSVSRIMACSRPSSAS